ncbi:MAG: arginine--tRNA ligase [Flavobacteriales bacterium]|nr:arginine--tRNA ligase [Flavobacteriales bacterium]
MIFHRHIEKISNLIIDYYHEYDILDKDIQIQETRKEFEGDWTIVLFPFVKIVKHPLSQLGAQLGDYLKEKSDFICEFNIVGGFLNLKFTDDFWFKVLDFSFSKDFEINPTTNQHIVVESCSPNTNKPLHLGHLRNILLGHAVANILVADGHQVTRVQIINDRGIHICKSMLAWMKFGQGDTPSKCKMKGDYFVGKYYVLFEQKYQEEQKELINKGHSVEYAKKNSTLLHEAKELLRKWEDGDKTTLDLWEQMNNWVYEGFEATYKKIGVSFDKNYYESDTYLIGKKYVLDGLNNGVFYEKEDSSIWADLNVQNLDDKLLLRSDGTAVYITQDLGTAIVRYDELIFDKMIYVVGNEQNHHFSVLFSILSKMGKAWSSNLQHLSYGMVNLPEGKMKSREGTVIDIDDLLEEMHEKSKSIMLNSSKIDPEDMEELSTIVGDAALKYFILKPDAKKNILFNPEDSIDFNGHTGPFIQYTYARIQSILQKTDSFIRTCRVSRSLLEEERVLIKLILNYPLTIRQASLSLNPSILANYLYTLSKEYNHFYQKIPILNPEDKSDVNFRVTISEKISLLIFKGMDLLGIKVPLKM